MGWKLLAEPPAEASEMRQAIEPKRAYQLPPRTPEYWFVSPEGRVLLCEPIAANGCGNTLNIVRKQQEGWVLEQGSPVEILCLH